MQRQSNFELLRILAMFLIVAHHYSVHGIWNYTRSFSINELYIQSLSFGGKIGVALFVLITGYFLFEKKSLNWNSIKSITIKTWFYSTSIFLIYYISGDEKVLINDVLKSFLPLSYWFINSFFCLLIISPYLNSMLHSLNKNSHEKLIAFLFLIIVTPILNKSVGSFGVFIFLYITGGYINKYFKDKEFKNKRLNCLILLNIGLIFGSMIIFKLLSSHDVFFYNFSYFTGLKTPFVLIASVLIFIRFKQIRIKESKIINAVSSTTFGIYLIHDNFILRKYLWVKEGDINIESNFIFFHSITSIIVIFTFSMVIEGIVKKLAMKFR